ncbi:5-formyltetrahydrofolate cyclo-ligase [Fictibacillus macauensis ZFHKF-1]|uniref:5-formyltetrahydrofolate cyclo-ligase n=1 Tax=Fictibacillus macauensis ZFHKF-1 TaxID=1196324 RepID=I8UED7_9BACL|nr:5-formyltetrahydrofolate cyclo-ligase [Fictibacillus macauensis]EIT85168.1 5-formyltetrahydrofolate cyclo-ligase [Fictibacillus macauensis ZFHKF-1]
MDKAALRSDMKKRLQNVSTDEHLVRADCITNKVVGMKEWQQAQTVSITISRAFEVSTKALIEASWAQGKRVCAPKCVNPSQRTMQFFEITSWDDLENVYLDLYEPKATCRLLSRNEIDLIIVPGLVFSPSGQRIGFGGGYYDRYLADYHGMTLALAYAFQVMEDIPAEPFDVNVQCLVTDEQIYTVEAQ